MRIDPESLARASSRHPWRTVVAWLVLVGSMGAVSSRLLSGALTNEVRFTDRPESVRAQELIEEKVTGERGETEFIIVRSDGERVGSARFRAYVEELADAVERSTVVDGRVSTVYGIREGIAELVTPDGDGIVIPLQLRRDGPRRIEELRGALRATRRPRFRVSLVDPEQLLARMLGRAAAGARELSRWIRGAARGSGALAEGLARASGGSEQLSLGIGRLREGAARLGGAARDLAGGAGGLAASLDEISVGARGLLDGTGDVREGTDHLAAGLAELVGVSEALTSSSRDLAGGAEGVAAGVDELVSGVEEAGAGAETLADGAERLEAGLEALAASDPELASDPAFQEVLAGAEGLSRGLDELSAGLAEAGSGGHALAEGAEGVADGSSQLAAALEQLGAGVGSVADGARELAEGTGRLLEGTEGLAGGLDLTADGASRLALGTGRLADGVAGLEDGAGGVAAGAEELKEGLVRLSGGASGLRSGLADLSGGSGRLASGLAQGRSQATGAAGGSGPAPYFVVVRSERVALRDPSLERYVEEVLDAVTAAGDGTLAAAPVNLFDAREQARGLVSEDGTATLIPVPIRRADASTVEELRRVIDEHRRQGFDVLLAGPATLDADVTGIAEGDLRHSEGIGIGIALLVLIVVFAAVVAPVLPIMMGLFSIAVALGLVALIGRLFEFSVFTSNMVSAIGLAVGIDYSLFIVSRYREERRNGLARPDAIAATGRTATRAVFFSGVTVVLALLGMFIIPTTIFRSMATGAILVTLAAIAASLTLLPALLALLGDRIDWPSLPRRARGRNGPAPDGGLWDRLTRGVMRAPVLSVVASALLLGGLAIPYLTIERGTAGVSTLPDDIPSTQAFEVLSEEFAGGQTDPVEVLVLGDVGSAEVRSAIDRLRERIADDPAFAARTTVRMNPATDASVVTALFGGDPQTTEAFDAIHRLRRELIPRVFRGVDAEVLVTGSTAFFTDFLDLADRWQPIVLAFVLGLSFLLLMVVFRSVVVPLKALLMNLLSVGAAYGAVVLVFQHGVGIGLFDALGFRFRQVEAIEAWLPLFLFSVLFGLSMDYHVFLLSRIREEYDRTGDNAGSVAHGLRTTAGIITGAALIMVAVFTALASGRLVSLQQTGFGLAVAVFLDATIVRSILVPASMKLLGDRNWYLPGWLRWLPRLAVEGGPPRRLEPVPAAATPLEAG